MIKTIVVTGGGSGGHITPLLAVTAELKKRQPHTRIVYIGQSGDGLIDIPTNDPSIDQVFTVRAGKFRRYHGEGFMQLLDLKTMFLNFRDFFYVIIGLWQSWRYLGKIRPEVVFSRGGFVSVPVGLGAAMRKIPYITHDSDPIPSLANRIIARWASVHAVAMPVEIYPYPQTKTITTGIPISDNFVSVSKELNNKYREEIDVPIEAKLLFIIGGGLGSKTVNSAVVQALPHLLQEFEDLYVVHVVGRNNLSEIQHEYSQNMSADAKSRISVMGFIGDVYRYSGAADLIITRAGATNLAEFAAQAKPCIVIPSAFLAAGHQTRSAEYLQEQGAAQIIDDIELEEDPNRLSKIVAQLLNNREERQRLAHNLSSFAKPNATKDIATLIIQTADKPK